MRSLSRGGGRSSRGGGGRGGRRRRCGCSPTRRGWTVLDAVAALPAGLCGVVFRHDGVAGRGGLARAVARLCRARRLGFVMAGDGEGMGARRHLRGGIGFGGGGSGGPGWSGATGSAHGRAEVVRGVRAGVSAVFLSPAFPTASHKGARVLGVVRWSGLARGAGVPVLALGGRGRDRSVRRLPRWVARGWGDRGVVGLISGCSGGCGNVATVFRDCHVSLIFTIAGLGVGLAILCAGLAASPDCCSPARFGGS